MGCCGSNLEKKIPHDVRTEIYGNSTTMALGPFYFQIKPASAIVRPPPPIAPPGKPKIDYNDALNGQPACGWELDFQWHARPEVPIPDGVKPWTEKFSQWFNGALLTDETCSNMFCSGREQVLFAGVLPPSAGVKDDVGFVALSTGRLLLLTKKKPNMIEGAYHIFDLQQITVADDTVKLAKAPPGLTFYAVRMEFGDMFPEGPRTPPEHVKKVDVELIMSKPQASMLIAALSKLSLALMRASLRVKVAPTLIEKFSVPRTPPDGGFLAVYRATCNYFGLPLNSVKIGPGYYSSIPLLELDLSGFDQLSAAHAAAVCTGLLRVQALRGFMLYGKPGGKGHSLQQEAWKLLLPTFGLGTIWKLHLTDIQLSSRMVQDLAAAMVARGANVVVDLDLTGAELDAAAVQSLVKSLETTRGTLRRIRFENCGLTAATALPLLTLIGNKCAKLEHLNLAKNNIGGLGVPHPLKPIWESPRLESVILSKTDMRLEELVDGLTDGQLATLRFLDISFLSLPPPPKIDKLWAALGTNIENIKTTGLFKSAEDLAAYLSLFSAPNKSPKLEINLSGDRHGLRAVILAALSKGVPPAGVTITPANDIKQAALDFNEMEPQIIRHYHAAKSQGLTAAPMREHVLKKTLESAKKTMKTKAAEWEAGAPALKSLASKRFVLRGLANDKSVINISIEAGTEIITTSGLKSERTGTGPGLAFMLAGLAENQSLKELDISDCTGGDTVAQVLGTLVLKQNRTLRSLKVTGNYFSAYGLTAIRSALYGNKKLVEFPFPDADCQGIISCYRTTVQQLEGSVLGYRADIKRAFKSTKGRRTPYVVQTLNNNVANIKGAKQKAARAKCVIKAFAKLHDEIQQAISANQKDPKNQAAFAKEAEKTNKENWKVAGKAMSKIQTLQKKKADLSKSQDAQLWPRRAEMAKMWVDKCNALKGKKDVKFLEVWIKQNTKEGHGLIVTGPAAEALLQRIPSELKSVLKLEIPKTIDFVKFEEEAKAKEQLLNCQIQEQNLVVSNCTNSPNYKPPPPAALPAGLTDEQKRKLTKPSVKATVATPPPDVIAGKIVAVQPPPSGGSQTPVVQGIIVGQQGQGVVMGQQVMAPTTVVQPSGTVQQSQYEQWRIYQQQQQQQAATYNQQYYGGAGPGKKYSTGTYMAGGAAAGLGVGFMGAYMYNHYHYNYWYDDPYYCGWGYRPYGYYGGYDHYHYGGYDHGGYEQSDYAMDQSEVAFVGDHIDQGVTDAAWETGDSFEPPEGYAGVEGLDATDVEAADGAVAMYAGGEDDRPGRGPHPGLGGTSVRAGPVEVWRPTPARLDLKEWFEERIIKAEHEAREEVLGRVGPLPCEREIILRSESKEAAVVCLVTQCSLDRLSRLEEQLASWDGEVSVAVFVDAPAEGLAAASARQDVLKTCATAAARRARGKRDLTPSWTVTLVYQLPSAHVRCPAYDLLYPINTLRNAALASARAKLVFLLDVDFVPSKDLYAILKGQDRGARLLDALCSKQPRFAPRSNGLAAPAVALVIPAFESLIAKQHLPSTGSNLREAHEAGEVEGFHVGHFPRGHQATDFDRWFAGPAKGSGPKYGRLVQASHGVNAYPVHYEEHFEPYVVVAKADVPAYDERFRGYGLNKISHLYEMSTRGFNFVTIDNINAFVVAGKHPKSQSWQRCVGPNAEAEQRARLATHYESFKLELKRGTAPCRRPATSSYVAKGVESVTIPADLSAAGFVEFLGRACGVSEIDASDHRCLASNMLKAAA